MDGMLTKMLRPLAFQQEISNRSGLRTGHPRIIVAGTVLACGMQGNDEIACEKKVPTMDISMIVTFHKSVLHLIEAPCVLSDLARSRGQNG